MKMIACAALATIGSFGFGGVRHAEASFINVIGYAPTVIYNNQTLNVTGPIVANFYYSQFGDDFYLARAC